MNREDLFAELSSRYAEYPQLKVWIEGNSVIMGCETPYTRSEYVCTADGVRNGIAYVLDRATVAETLEALADARKKAYDAALVVMEGIDRAWYGSEYERRCKRLEAMIPESVACPGGVDMRGVVWLGPVWACLLNNNTWRVNFGAMAPVDETSIYCSTARAAANAVIRLATERR